MHTLTPADLESIRQRARSDMSLREGRTVPDSSRARDLLLCSGTGCHASGSLAVLEALKHALAERGLQQDIRIVETGCNGFCAQGPLMLVQPDGILYKKLSVADVPAVVDEHFVQGRPVEKLFYCDPSSKRQIAAMQDIPFYALQQPIVLRNRGMMDAEKITEYIGRDGYRGAVQALLEMTPDQIVEAVKQSGLRGRGGAGFQTGLKWEYAALASDRVKYVLCNADEGDPGAFMDRSVLEADPHAVLEGMLIAARSIGAQRGYIYCRAEYPLALRRLNIAIEQARDLGLLGENILGSGFDFDLEVYQGAGAFVCGEETALISSIEGRRGMPRPRPPFPAQKGLWGCPTVLNNVETYANIPQIITNGPEWFSAIGTETSKGTKVFALTGDVNNIGLVEVPMGTSLRTIIYDIGGGIPNKRKFKAVQLGGPSGGCVSEKHLDIPVDYESIASVGAIMGSGGMIVMNDKTCMVDMARFFMDFIQDESCGKCTPCREGTRRMLELLQRITRGEGQEGDIERLEDLCDMVKDSSLCGLGQTAPNPVLSTLLYFRDEYEAHIRQKKCTAKRCPALLEFTIDQAACKKCGICFKCCPVQAVAWKKGETARIDRAKCVKCMSCITGCPFDAIN